VCADILKYPPSRIETLVVPCDLETVIAALVNHVEGYANAPRLKPVKSLSSHIREYEVITGMTSHGSDGQLERDEWVTLGTIRLTVLPGNNTELVITRYHWASYSTSEYVNTDLLVEWFLEFFERFTDTMVTRYGARLEKVLSPVGCTSGKRIKIGREQMTPAWEGIGEPARLVERITAPFGRPEIYNHLRALCNHDARFSILNPEADREPQNLPIGDAQAIRQRDGISVGAIIGTVQLLPAGSDTSIVFVAEDALFHGEITDEDQDLFREFVRCVKRTVATLTHQQAQTETLPVKENAIAVSASPPVQSEPTGAPAPSQAQTEPPPSTEAGAPEPKQLTDDSADKKPWESIPDVGYTHFLVECVHNKWSSSRIAQRLGLTVHTINNRVSELRRLYGEVIVPRRRKGPR